MADIYTRRESMIPGNFTLEKEYVELASTLSS